MTSALWIGIGAAILVILGHVALFWFFIRPGKDDDGAHREGEQDHEEPPYPSA